MKLPRIAATLAGVLMAGQAMAQDVIDLKFAVFTPEQEITYQEAIKPWVKAVEEASGGVVKIQLYPGGILGRDGSKQIKLLNDGVADIAFIIPAYNPGLFPDNWVVELPDTSQTATEGSVAFWRMVDAGKLRGYQDFEVLSMVATSPYFLHGNEPMNQIGDLKGQKIRIAGKLEQQCVEALGGVPVGMPITKIPESLSRGIIDATPLHYAALYAFGIASATTYHYQNALGSMPFGFVMPRQRFDALPEVVRNAMRDAGGEKLARIFGAAMDAENQRRLDETRATAGQTVVVPTDADKAAWSAVMADCSGDFVAGQENGAALTDAFKAELARIRAE